MIAEFKGNLKSPDLNLQADLEIIAKDIFVRSLQKYIKAEQDINGRRYPRLAESTVRQKARLGLSRNILQATRRLINDFVVRRSGQTKVIIKLSSARTKVGAILQNEGVRSKAQGGVRRFNFFGISREMEKIAMQYMRKRIAEEIKK